MELGRGGAERPGKKTEGRGKGGRWGQPLRAWTHDYPCLWTGQYPMSMDKSKVDV